MKPLEKSKALGTQALEKSKELAIEGYEAAKYVAKHPIKTAEEGYEAAANVIKHPIKTAESGYDKAKSMISGSKDELKIKASALKEQGSKLKHEKEEEVSSKKPFKLSDKDAQFEIYKKRQNPEEPYFVKQEIDHRLEEAIN